MKPAVAPFNDLKGVTKTQMSLHVFRDGVNYFGSAK